MLVMGFFKLRKSAGMSDKEFYTVWQKEAEATLETVKQGAIKAMMNVRQQIPFGYHTNPEEVMAALKRIAREGKYILPTHDAEVHRLYASGLK